MKKTVGLDLPRRDEKGGNVVNGAWPKAIRPQSHAVEKHADRSLRMRDENGTVPASMADSRWCRATPNPETAAPEPD
tara:strand:+ start:8033 stop:8263 length:231 start_codon:yes stop_codon:yes gene_type:complete